MPALALAWKLDALERFGVAHADLFAELLVPVVPARQALVFPAHAHLAGVTVEGLYLAFHGGGDVHEGIGVVRGPEIDFLDLVGLQPFLKVLGIGEVVTGEGEDGVQDDAAAHAVIAVDDVLAVGVHGEDDVRTVLANGPHYFFAEVAGVFQALVRVAEEGDVADAHEFDGGELLLFAYADEIL